jgi:squalene-hopene/tetraprenyl-beta-curcumene cyclase
MKFSPKILTVSFAATLSIVACAFAQSASDAQRRTIATPGQLPHAKLPDNVNDRVQYLIDRGLNYLKTQQKDDGGWQRENDPPGVTAIVLRAFVRDEKFPARTPFVKKGYDKLFTYQLDSGGIYQDLLANYNTAIAISAIAAANEPAYRERMDKAVAFLKQLQWTEETKGPKGETVADKSNNWYGGWGYGRHGRPDLSNAQVAIEALHDAGLKPQDKAYQAALVFLTRTQNNSETNDQPWTGDDGGFVYTPANKGESMAGETTTGADGRRGLRSYGSMTYAGLKSMIYAGLSPDDPRVKAAVDWVTRHWTLDENPAMRQAGDEFARQGLYYYFYTFAHALDAYDEPVITDVDGKTHDWRLELIDKLATLQKDDGSWVGEKRWMEDNPVLTTAYVVLALQEAQRDLKEHPPRAR